MIDGEKQILFHGFVGLKTVAIDVGIFGSRRGEGTGLSPITVTVSEKQLRQGLTIFT